MLDRPLFVPKIYFYPIPIPYHTILIPIPSYYILIPSHFHLSLITSCVLLQLLLSLSCRMVRFFVPKIYFYSITILSDLIPIPSFSYHLHSIPFPSHHLLCTPPIVALILLLDGPLFCAKIYFYPIPVLSHLIHIPFTFHPLFIPSPLVTKSCVLLQ